jgi:hypothetical protein
MAEWACGKRRAWNGGERGNTWKKSCGPNGFFHCSLFLCCLFLFLDRAAVVVPTERAPSSEKFMHCL